LLRAVAEQGYTTPTPIQAQAIPVVLAGRDLLGAAQTGTGKTAGFTLPLLQILSSKANGSHSPARHPVRALVVTPTRELCAQVEDSVRNYGKYIPLKSITVYGGVGIHPRQPRHLLGARNLHPRPLGQHEEIGRVLLVEMVLPPGDTPHPGKLLDMMMLVGPGGQERTEAEYHELFGKAGLRITRVVPTASPVSVVEAVRA